MKRADCWLKRGILVFIAILGAAQMDGSVKPKRSKKDMSSLITISSEKDIPEWLRGTPVGMLLATHNVGARFRLAQHQLPPLLIGTCMDYRISLKIPPKFAYIIRTAGANMSDQEFPIAFALSTQKVKGIAIIGHTECGMAELNDKKDPFVSGLEAALKWTPEKAGELFDSNVDQFNIGTVVPFTLQETVRLRSKFPGVIIAPLLYDVSNGKLYVIREKPALPAEKK